VGSREETNTRKNKMTGITTWLALITLNFNGLTFPVKRHRLVGWTKKAKTQPFVA
jgi:hypothetical protein